MTADTDRVAQILSNPEDVDLPEDLAAQAKGPAGDPEDPGPTPDDRGGDDGLPPPGEPTDGDGIDWGKVQRASELPMHDVGNGKRFAIYYGTAARFVPNIGWHIWDTTRWKFDPPVKKDAPGGVATRKLVHCMSDWIARETVFLRPRDETGLHRRQREIRQRLDELESIPSKERTAEASAEIGALRAERTEIEGILSLAQDKVAQRLRHAKQAGNTATMNNMLNEGGVMLAATVDQLDADPLKVNLLNGTLHFKVATHGKIRRAEVAFMPHDPADLITKRMNVAYDPAARSPTFQAFLNLIQPEPEMQGYLQRAFGLSMLAVIEQVIFFFYGDGANGKSVLVDLMHRLMDDYAAKAKIESLTGSNKRSGGDATPDLVPLIGARLATCAEPAEGVSWQESFIKEMTGGEPMLIRGLFGDFVEVIPYHKTFVSGNHKPEFKGGDDGIWRRVKIIEFPVQIPEADRRPKQEVDAELFAEASGILNWLIEGALAYLEGGLMEPASVKADTAELREESDPYGAFLDEACEITGDSDDRIGAAEFVNAFNYWLTARAWGTFRDRTVEKKMSEKTRKWRSRRTGQKFARLKSGGRMFYTGVKFTAFFGKDWDAAPKDVRGRALSVGKVQPDETPDTPSPDYSGEY